jgi:homoserine kinase
MGGSAASAVAAIVAANAFLKTPLPPEKQLHYALLGEAVASGAAHADNAAPCLLGGLILTLVSEPLEYVSLPVPRGILCVLVHPHLRVDTKTARGILRREISLSEHVSQSARLAGFIAACYRDDLSLLKRSLTDLIIEPQRAKLVPGFAEAKAEALQAGALGCSLSGSGPSVFAWTDSAKSADRIAGAMVVAFEKAGHSADRWISPVSPSGARILSQE